MLDRLKSKGYRPMMAHPERNRYMELPDYRHLRESGIHFQLNLGSLTGYYGSSVKKNAEFLLAKGWYSAFGSDCHRLRTIKEQYEIKAIASKVAVSLKKAGYLELQ
jgi:tyrosine-protein phosphatase YwqE